MPEVEAGAEVGMGRQRMGEAVGHTPPRPSRSSPMHRPMDNRCNTRQRRTRRHRMRHQGRVDLEGIHRIPNLNLGMTPTWARTITPMPRHRHRHRLPTTSYRTRPSINFPMAGHPLNNTGH